LALVLPVRSSRAGEADCRPGKAGCRAGEAGCRAGLYALTLLKGLAMSLRSYLESVGTVVDTDAPALNLGRLRLLLRTRLFERLPSEKVAYLLANDIARARLEVKAVLEQCVKADAFMALDTRQKAALCAEVADMVLGFGPLEELLEDSSVTEIMVNGANKVFYERNGRISACSTCFYDEQQLRMVIDRIVGPLGRREDEQSPLVSARLRTGHRVHVVIPPLALDGPVLTIRKFREKVYTLEELVALGSRDVDVAAFLCWAVRSRRNIAVSGGTGSGKTTLLNALSVLIPHTERIITIEDAAELRFGEHPHVVRLEARPANAEGTGQVSIRDLVINALRMRPDRIVVGECRGAEALDMLQAMNTGHDGSLTTLHANSPYEVINRLIMMSRYAMDLPVALIEEQIVSALGLIVQMDRFADGSRRVSMICDCVADAKGAKAEPIANWDGVEQRYVWLRLPRWLDELCQGNAQHGDGIIAKEVAAWRSGLSI
jgi:pilus assembly protein CpaF